MRISQIGITGFLAAALAAPGLFAAGIIPANVTVGESLEVIANLTLGEAAPAGGVELTLTSSDPARLKFSTTPEGVGAPVLKLKVAEGYRGSPDYYIQGFGKSGTVGYTVSAPGYDAGSGTVTLAPSGLILARSGMGLPSLLTTTGSGKTELVLYTALLDTEMNFVHPQPLAAGRSVRVEVTSSNPKAGGIMPGTITLGEGTASTAVAFQPLGVGETVLSISMPAGFSEPAQFARVTINVIAPGMAVTDEISIGHNLQTGGNISLGEPAPAGGVVVTLTSGDPKKLLLTLTPHQLGSECIELKIPGGGVHASYHLQALAGEGSVTYTATAPGFRPRTATVALTPSGLVLGGPQGPPDEAELLVKEIAEGPHGMITSMGQKEPTVVTAYTVQLDPVTRRGADLTVQPVRAGVSIQAVLTNSNPVAGTLKSMDMSIPAGASSAVTHFTPKAVGTTVIAVNTPQGYTKAGNSTALTVTVKE